MDIKTRITALSEQEAKAALMRCVDLLSTNIHCSDCINGVDVEWSIMPCGGAQKCKSYWLDEALKEAQK